MFVMQMLRKSGCVFKAWM